MPTVRIAIPDDAAAVARIYEPYVRDTAVSFELEPPSVDQMRVRIEQTLPTLPWLVFEVDGDVLGYAYASRHQERAAYQWAVNVSVYVSPSWHRRGAGRQLYAALLEMLRAMGFHRAYAGITLPNVASVRVHESFGFAPVGVYRRVGFKHGAWHDVGWWQLSLRDEDVPSAPPAPFASLVAARRVEPLLRAALGESR